MPVHTLVRIDSRPIGNRPDEIRAFMTLRDEMQRLPQNFEHHRKIGVARFFAIDNGSTDGTKEFLLAQPDCHVFLTHNSYSEATCGLEWQHALLDEYGIDHWCLIVDADELFIYPGYEKQPLPDMAAYLDRNGAQGMFAFLLDMYGPGTIGEAIAASGRSLLEACRYFDSQYVWRSRFRIPILQGPRFPEFDIIGGPRLRMLFPLLYRHYYLLRAIWHINHYLKVPLPAALKSAPALTKIPFVRWLPGTRYQSPHATTPINLSGVTGVLLHFKFLEDFYSRVNIQLNRKEHRGDGIWITELERYLNKLKQNPSLKFRYPGSVAYEGSEQLLRLGLLKEDQQWRRIRTIAHDTRHDESRGFRPEPFGSEKVPAG
jgi:glycosyltransferase involved in cell wall biosynthesis